LATFRNLSQDYGDLESGEFGPYVPWKILCKDQNHIFQVQIWWKFASKRKNWFQLPYLVAVFCPFNVTRGFCFSSVMTSTIWLNFPKNSKIKHIYTAQKKFQTCPNFSRRMTIFLSNKKHWI
jgi:hypothetical protein